MCNFNYVAEASKVSGNRQVAKLEHYTFASSILLGAVKLLQSSSQCCVPLLSFEFCTQSTCLKYQLN